MQTFIIISGPMHTRHLGREYSFSGFRHRCGVAYRLPYPRHEFCIDPREKLSESCSLNQHPASFSPCSPRLSDPLLPWRTTSPSRNTSPKRPSPSAAASPCCTSTSKKLSHPSPSRNAVLWPFSQPTHLQPIPRGQAPTAMLSGSSSRQSRSLSTQSTSRHKSATTFIFFLFPRKGN